MWVYKLMSQNIRTYHHFILAPSPSPFFLSWLASFLHLPPPSFPTDFPAMFLFPLSLFLRSQAVKPHFVATAMSGIRRASRFIPDPVTYTIGIQHITYGYFYHAMQVGISVAMVTDLSVF